MPGGNQGKNKSFHIDLAIKPLDQVDRAKSALNPPEQVPITHTAANPFLDPQKPCQTRVSVGQCLEQEAVLAECSYPR